MQINNNNIVRTRITYNNIGHVDSILFENNAKVAYTYSLNGEKLRVAHWTDMSSAASANGSTTGGILNPSLPNRSLRTTEYIGGDVEVKGESFIYGNTYKYYFGDGYVRFYPGSTRAPEYYYYSKDHLGNVRSVVTKNPSTNEIVEVQQTHYYPFGGIIADISSGTSVQNKLCNGKELDTSNNLWWYDYGARQYDPTAPRFTTPDPLAEKYYGWNAYVYCKNNPVNRIDPNGMEDYFNLNGDFIYHEGDNNDKYYVINTSLDEHEIRQSVADNNFVLAPNQDVIDKMDILFNNSDNGSKIEQGFNVYVDNELGGIQDGLENEISLVSGEGKLYDVHIHQFNGPDGKIGKAKPSDYDKDNNQYNVSIVLGYGSNTKHRQTHINDKQIGFYSNNMTKTIKYGDFKNAIQKIISY